MKIIPITLKQANDFILKNHRHNSRVVGCKFCIGLQQDNELCGVAVVGRPVSRILDNGLTCEINRLCTNGLKTDALNYTVRVAVLLGKWGIQK